MIKEEIHKVPFIRLLFAYIFGLLIGRYFVLGQTIHIVLFVGCVIGLMVSERHNKIRLSYKRRWWSGVFILIMILNFGSWIYINHEEKVVALDAEVQHCIATVLELPQEKANTNMLVASINSEKNVTGKALLFLQKDSASLSLKVGDQIFFQAGFDSITRTSVPFGFNYAWWMHKQHIVSRTRLKRGKWYRLSVKDQNKFLNLRQQVKDHVKMVFFDKIDNKGYGLVSALLIGEKRFLDREQKQKFKTAGVLHVMAISGLHIGILYVFLSGILFFMKRNKNLRFIRSVIIWIILALFAFVAGFSPSVVRAVWMFILVDAGQLLVKKSSIYNILSVSAFVILVIDPHSVFSPGFWLSYAAVISIVTFFPYVKQWWNPTNKPLMKIRDLLALSISVQPGTAPLSIYLFNQFPVWFLLSNIIAVPLVGVIINLSFLILLLDLLSISPPWLFQLLQYVLNFLDSSLSLIALLPGSVIESIALNGFELGILLSISSLFGYLIWIQDRKLFISVLVLCNIFMFSILFRNISNHRKSEIVIFESYGAICVFEKSGRKGQWLVKQDTNTIYDVLSKYKALLAIKELEAPILENENKERTVCRKRPGVMTYNVNSRAVKYLITTLFPAVEKELLKSNINKYGLAQSVGVLVFISAETNSPVLMFLFENRDGLVLFVDSVGVKVHSLSKNGFLRIKTMMQNTK